VSFRNGPLRDALVGVGLGLATVVGVFVGSFVLWLADEWQDAHRWRKLDDEVEAALRAVALNDACRQFVAADGVLPRSIDELALHTWRRNGTVLPTTDGSGRRLRLERRADGLAVRVLPRTGWIDSVEPEWVEVRQPQPAARDSN